VPGIATIDGAATFQVNAYQEGHMAMADSQNIKANEKTYGGFIGALKWSVPLIAALAFVVILVIQ
jgi:hypothetical protein